LSVGESVACAPRVVDIAGADGRHVDMSGDAAIAGLFPVALSAYFCCYGPGQAWWRGRASGLPRAFARLALSLLLTSVVALVLVAAEAFSLPRLVAIGGTLTLAGYLGVARVRHIEQFPLRRRAHHAGVLVFLLALALYWPPFEAHLAASDASSYLAAGVQLARHHELSKEDDLGPLVPPIARGALFFSALGMPWKPPYSRMHGGLVVDKPGAPEAHPSFFPLPSAWAGIFADALGTRYAGGYVGLFAAVAVWAAWLLARARLGVFGAAVVTVLTAVNAAAYWAGRMPLSEPLAWFFAAAGLAALDAYEDEGFPADARLAGALLGATAIARVEYAGFLLVALCARRVLRPTLTGRPLTPGFVVAFAAMLAVAALEVFLVRGAYIAPLVDAWWGMRWIAESSWREGAWRVLALGAIGAAVYALALRRFGFTRATAAAIVVAFAAVYARLSSDPDVVRSLRWLGAYVGWPAVLLAVAGGAHAWRDRFAQPANGFLLIVLGLFAACLIYDPHVFPAMPWASRRFVPIVVPCGLLLAAMACSEVWRRSMVAGLVAWGLLAGGVIVPASKSWGRDYYAGTYDQLNELVAKLPPEGALLIDNRLVGTVLAPALWLVHGRNSLPVQTMSDNGRAIVAGMTRILDDAGKGPVHLIKPTTTRGPEPIPFTRSTRVLDFPLALALPEQTDGSPPATPQTYIEYLSVDRLDPVK
jgi:hypothetical protein